jgi:hypothetical protein
MFKFSITDFFLDLKGFTSNLLGREDPGVMSTDAACATYALPGNDDCFPSVNPASGLPMINGDNGVDAGGNCYGFSDSSLFD